MNHDPALSSRQPKSRCSFLGLELGTSLDLADKEALTRALHSYKYVSPPSSLFERIWLMAFWEWVQRTMYPRWLAPNMITFIGFLCVMVSFVSMLYYSPMLDGSCPPWWYLLTAVTCFVYQTCDGSDGKQARATKSGSALGELFDHGVDAIVTPIFVAFTIEFQGFGIFSPVGLAAILFSQTAFAVSNLTLLHTGRQEFNTVDCQEVQVVMQGALLLTYLFPDVWVTELAIPFKNITWLFSLLPPEARASIMPPGKEGVFYLRGLTMGWSVCCMAFNVTRGIFTISSHNFVDTDGQTSRELKEGQGRSAWIQQLCTCLVYVFANYVCWSCSASKHRVSTNPMMSVCWLLVSITTFGDSMAHLLFTRVGQLPFPQLYRNRGAWLLTAFWVFFGHDQLVLLIATVSVVSSLQYVTSMGRCTADALKINVFSIPYKE